MQSRVLLILAASVASVAIPCSAVTVVNGSCASISDAHGCLFSGSITSATTADTNAKFNLYNDANPGAGANIALQYLFKSDDVGFAGMVSNKTSGTWSLPGYHIRYVAVSAGSNFALYRLPGQFSSGVWSTTDIPHGANLREVRDVVFFGAAVPEPASWAMIIAGFGLAGTAIRRQRRPSGAAAA
jgi:hypothetical protein